MTGITVRDVAREADVSLATVSRVLNGVTTVDPVLAERVRSTATRLGYVPNSIGRSLRLQQTNSWAVVVNTINPFIAALVMAVEDAAQAEGTSVRLGITGFDPERERNYVEAAVSQRVSGLLVASSSRSDHFVNVPMPVVFVDMPDPHGHDSVTIDNYEAGRLAADHLADQGFHHPGMIDEGVPGQPVAERARGFRERLAERGISLAEQFVRHTDLSLSASRDAAADLLTQPSAPDVLYCVNGPSTQGAYFGLQAVPNRDTALLGTDDEVWTSLATPAVTVVSQPVTEIGQIAAQLIRDRRANPSAPARHVVLHPHLIPRESTRTPRHP